MCMWICGRNKEETLLKLFPAIDKRMIILRFLSQVWRNTNAYTKANDLSAVIDAGNLSLKNPRSPNTEWRTKLGNSRCQLFRDLITSPMRPPHWHSRGCGILHHYNLNLWFVAHSTYNLCVIRGSQVIARTAQIKLLVITRFLRWGSW